MSKFRTTFVDRRTGDVDSEDFTSYNAAKTAAITLAAFYASPERIGPVDVAVKVTNLRTGYRVWQRAVRHTGRRLLYFG